MTTRREQLLAAAAELFASKGYHAVGIDDIGAAAGISGPGVYRHFAGKQALLEALCDRAMGRMLDGARAAGSLDELVELHVDFAVRERALIGVWAREARALPDDARRSLRRRMRAYEQPWREVLAALRPELTADEVALAVRSTLTMLNAAALADVDVPADRARTLLRRMALAALLTRRAPAPRR